MTKQTSQKGTYYIVSPGIWPSRPCRYSSLRSALHDFIAGTPFDKIRDRNKNKDAKSLELVRELSLDELAVTGDLVTARCSPDKLTKDQPFYLIRTYTFDGDNKGYDVVECSTISELQAEANKNISAVSNLRNILTKGLELKLLEQEDKK
ncbi:hypothetical protein HY642_00025 [Candidatus Woesearchaeota archaeon]|nr:hypothetical protein [Candidatus Woesearchaeota archaeon]